MLNVEALRPRLLRVLDRAVESASMSRDEALSLLDDYDAAERRRELDRLIERSSLGGAEAKAARESVPAEVGSAIATAAKYLARAEAAEGAVERAKTLSADWLRRETFEALVSSSEPVTGRLIGNMARALNAALAEGAAGGGESGTETEGRG